MANSTTRIPWVCDTAGVLLTSPVKLREIIWEEMTSDGDTIQVQDNSGNRIWYYACPTSGTGASYNQEFYGRWITGGLKINQIDSGVLIFIIE